MSKKLNEMIIELARFSPMSWTLKTEQDKQNLCEFVKAFALDALHDSDIRNELFKEEMK